VSLLAGDVRFLFTEFLVATVMIEESEGGNGPVGREE
jgi:hypothetical protein